MITLVARDKQREIITPKLQLVAWEITRSCNLFCAHCRASAEGNHYPDELSTEECLRLVDQIVEIGRPILILTGGEPLKRADVFMIAKYASKKSLRVVMGTNGTLINQETAAQLKDVPVSRVAVSLDFPAENLQDEFRGKTGAYKEAIEGIVHLRRAGVEVQINSTITKLNAKYLDQLLALALEQGAVAFHPFMLVPTGRGKGLRAVELSPHQYEETLNWIYDRQHELGDRIFFKPTDAPHYLRIMKQRQASAHETDRQPPSAILPNVGQHPANTISRGCLAGTGFCFVSHRGRVQGCGYLDVEAGNVRQKPFTDIWASSPLFNDLRNLGNLRGKCGMCEYKRICGGCRARAYEVSGDYLQAEPYCIYQPKEGASRV